MASRRKRKGAPQREEEDDDYVTYEDHDGRHLASSYIPTFVPQQQLPRAPDPVLQGRDSSPQNADSDSDGDRFFRDSPRPPTQPQARSRIPVPPPRKQPMPVGVGGGSRVQTKEHEDVWRQLQSLAQATTDDDPPPVIATNNTNAVTGHHVTFQGDVQDDGGGVMARPSAAAGGSSLPKSTASRSTANGSNSNSSSGGGGGGGSNSNSSSSSDGGARMRARLLSSSNSTQPQSRPSTFDLDKPLHWQTGKGTVAQSARTKSRKSATVSQNQAGSGGGGGGVGSCKSGVAVKSKSKSKSIVAPRPQTASAFASHLPKMEAGSEGIASMSFRQNWLTKPPAPRRPDALALATREAPAPPVDEIEDGADAVYEDERLRVVGVGMDEAAGGVHGPALAQALAQTSPQRPRQYPEPNSPTPAPQIGGGASGSAWAEQSSAVRGSGGGSGRKRSKSSSGALLNRRNKLSRIIEANESAITSIKAKAPGVRDLSDPRQRAEGWVDAVVVRVDCASEILSSTLLFVHSVQKKQIKERRRGSTGAGGGAPAAAGVRTSHYGAGQQGGVADDGGDETNGGINALDSAADGLAASPASEPEAREGTLQLAYFKNGPTVNHNIKVGDGLRIYEPLCVREPPRFRLLRAALRRPRAKSKSRGRGKGRGGGNKHVDGDDSDKNADEDDDGGGVKYGKDDSVKGTDATIFDGDSALICQILERINLPDAPSYAKDAATRIVPL